MNRTTMTCTCKNPLSIRLYASKEPIGKAKCDKCGRRWIYSAWVIKTIGTARYDKIEAFPDTTPLE